MYQLLINATNKHELEKLLILYIIGVVDGLESELVTIDEAEKLLFSPYTIDLVDSKGISKEIIDIIHLGTELEDVQSLIPDKLSESLKQIKDKSIKILAKQSVYKIENKIICNTK